MHRFSAFNDNKELLQLIPGPNYSGYAHPYTEKWFKYFDNEPTRLYNYDRTVNLLWLLTKHFGMTCYFVNLFTTAPTSDMDITPDYAWLLPRNKCLSEFIIPVNGDFDGIVVSDDSAFLTNDQWKSQKVALEKYIKPGYCHPNVIGHRHIADRLIEILEKR